MAIAKSKTRTRLAVQAQDPSEGGHDLWLFTDRLTGALGRPPLAGRTNGRLRVAIRSALHNQCRGRPKSDEKSKAGCHSAQARLWPRLQDGSESSLGIGPSWTLRPGTIYL